MDFVTEELPKSRSAVVGDQSDEEEIAPDSCPAHRDVIPSDLQDFTPMDDVIMIVGTQSGKVTRIGGLEEMTNLKVCWCILLRAMTITFQRVFRN